MAVNAIQDASHLLVIAPSSLKCGLVKRRVSIIVLDVDVSSSLPHRQHCSSTDQTDRFPAAANLSAALDHRYGWHISCFLDFQVWGIQQHDLDCRGEGGEAHRNESSAGLNLAIPGCVVEGCPVLAVSKLSICVDAVLHENLHTFLIASCTFNTKQAQDNELECRAVKPHGF